MSQQGYERPEEVLRDADIAMYRAKLKGKACAVIFDPSMRVQAVSRLEMESELRQALENEVLQLYYQPIYSISQNRTIGFEALLRWSHSMHGFIPPAEFIPIAEETGLIIPLGQWVLKQACYQLKEWQQRFPTFPPLEISVNVSSRQISQPDFIEGIEEVLNLTQMDARWLTLEITESALMLHTDVVTENIRKLVDLGIRLSIDDFGTGYSSLGYIQRFPIHTIKIDRSFVQDIAHQSRRSEIVEPILRFTTELGLRTVAEGVESKEQLDRLAELGCRYVQGYYIARPLAPENVVEHLTNERERTVATALLKEPLEAAFYPAAGRF